MSDVNHYVTLGRSGLRVSPLCLGAMTFGEEWGFGSDVETSYKVIDAYMDRGGNFIDTANMYTKGHSEAILGDHLGKNPRKRDSVVLATKWLGNMYRDDPNGGGAHRKAMFESVDQSLRRLQTDYIDLLWMHFWDSHTPIEETMRGLDDLVSSGKVRYIGFSDTPAWKCAQAQLIAHFRGWSPLIALQIEYSLIERTPEGELFPMAEELGLGITPWSPLKGGLLTGKYSRDKKPSEDEAKRIGGNMKHLEDERALGIIDALLDVAKKAERTPAEVALAWCRQRQGVDSVIIGARTLEQLEKNLASASLTLSDEFVARLDEASKPALNFPHDFLQFVRTAIHNGTTINHDSREQWDASPKDASESW
ncbi:MAG: aldo/keto reductase [Planctomycetota bacterium]